MSHKVLGSMIAGLLALCLLVAGCQSEQQVVRTAIAPKANVPLKASPDYRVGASDVLTIEVRAQPDLAKTVVVRPDGKITLVLLDDVYVQGLNLQEIDDKLTRL